MVEIPVEAVFVAQALQFSDPCSGGREADSEPKLDSPRHVCSSFVLMPNPAVSPPFQPAPDCAPAYGDAWCKEQLIEDI